MSIVNQDSMSYIEKWQADIRSEYVGQKFSEVLEAWLDLRKRGPDESSGYTDKDYYYRMDVLKSLIDEMSPVVK